MESVTRMPSSTVGLQIRTFRAKSMQAAMAMIRQELGPSAAILETRPITSSMTRWLTGNRIEVTASSAIDQPASTATMSAATSNLVASQAAEKQRASTSPATEAHRSSAMTSRHQERVTRTTANPAQVPSLGKQADRLESLAWEKWQQEREREERGRGRSKSAAGMELSRLLWEELQEVGFSAEWAERLLQATRDSLHHQAWENESLMRGKMAHWVQHQLSIAPAIPHEMGSDRPYVVACGRTDRRWENHHPGKASRLANAGREASRRTDHDRYLSCGARLNS